MHFAHACQSSIYAIFTIRMRFFFIYIFVLHDAEEESKTKEKKNKNKSDPDLLHCKLLENDNKTVRAQQYENCRQWPTAWLKWLHIKLNAYKCSRISIQLSCVFLFGMAGKWPLLPHVLMERLKGKVEADFYALWNCFTSVFFFYFKIILTMHFIK